MVNMMFRVKNWSSLQSYKDRNPPWIRLHKKLIDNMSFQRMSADARALLPMIWLMASEDEDPVSGMLRIGYEEITFRLRLDHKIVKSAIDEIIRAGFIERADDPEMPLFNEIKQEVTEPLRDCYETVTQRQRQSTETDKKEDTIVSSKKNLNGCRIDYFLTNHPDGGIDSQNCPDDLGNWAIEEFRWDIKKTMSVWGMFCDYWLAKTGAGATKRDWPATWRNWCRKAAEQDARSDYILTQQSKRSYVK